MEGRIGSTGIEKFTLHDGSYRLIYRPRIQNYMDGKKASGSVAQDDGRITYDVVLLDLGAVASRCHMGWDHVLACLVDAEPIEPVGSA